MLGSTIGAASKQFNFEQSLVHDPLIYKKNIYGYSVDNQLVKLNPFGKKIWAIDVHKPKTHKLKIHFNHLFDVNSLGNLNVYDAQLGHQLYEKDGLEIKAYELSFPYLFYTSKHNHLGAIDFFSGQTLWINTTLPIRSFLAMGHSPNIVGLTHKFAHIIDRASGKSIKKIELPRGKITLVKAWNQGFLLEGSRRNYVYRLSTERFKQVKYPKTHTWFLEDNQIRVEDNQRSFSHMNIESDLSNWEERLPSQTITVLFGDTELMSITASHNAFIYDYRTGELTELVDQAVSHNADQQFFKIEDTLYLVNKSTVKHTDLTRPFESK